MNKIILGDWLKNNIEDKSIDVIMADPPSFEVKGEFDFIWSSFEEYLIDVERWAVECKRVLKDNGSLFWWGHAKKIAYAQIIFDKYFNLENSLVWHKIDAQTNKNRPEDMRSFKPVTERVLFYSNEVIKTGIEEINANPELFKDIKIYFDEWLTTSGLTLKEATVKIGSSSTHWFGFSERDKQQFSFPTKDKWDIMESIHPFKNSFSNINCKYSEYKKSYEDLKSQYEYMRRPFNLEIYNFTDIIKASQEAHLTSKYKHDTQKPPTLIKKLLQTTTRKDSKILIPFGGSGTDVESCIDLGLNYTCYEIDEKHYKTIKAREKECLKQPHLF